MPIPHNNYDPAANTVEVLDRHGQPDPRWTWDGHNFRHDGKVHKPSTHAKIIGRPGSEMDGWTWDWHLRAWMQPDAPIVVQPRPASPASMIPPATGMAPIATIHHKEEHMQHCHPHRQENILDGLKNHWATPLLGLAVMIASDFLTEPTPPTFPPGLTDDQKAYYQMQYQANLVKYQGYQRKLDKYGGIILGLGTANAAIAANGTNTQQHVATAPAVHRAM